jgi:putative transcriptional regulator
MKTALARYHRKQTMKDLDELDRWAADQPSAYRKVPVAPVNPQVVKAARQSSGLTQAKFAAALGVNATTVRFWENGQRNPDGLARKVLRLIAKHPGLVGDLAKV